MLANFPPGMEILAMKPLGVSPLIRIASVPFIIPLSYMHPQYVQYHPLLDPHLYITM